MSFISSTKSFLVVKIAREVTNEVFEWHMYKLGQVILKRRFKDSFSEVKGIMRE